jgi:multimeric flavodoxin WrbA
MNYIVISYSLTGNNAALAKGIVAEFAAEHIIITEPKPRNTAAIIFDMIFNRTPKVNPDVAKVAAQVSDQDLVILMGPVWMGQAASPLRACFKQLHARLGKYAFVSLSGGAMGPNSKLADDLKKRIGKEPAALIDLHIADLLPSEPKPTMKDTGAYRINEKDAKSLTARIVQILRETMTK